MKTKKIRINFRKALKRIRTRFPKSYSKKLPVLYAAVVLVSVILFLAIAVFPQLVFCTELFGGGVCLPFGAYLMFLVNIPGYYITGNILKVSPDSPAYFTMLLVALFSFLTYFLIGLFLDKIRDRKLRSDELIKYFVIVSFSILVLTAIMLWR